MTGSQWPVAPCYYRQQIKDSFLTGNPVMCKVNAGWIVRSSTSIMLVMCTCVQKRVNVTINNSFEARVIISSFVLTHCQLALQNEISVTDKLGSPSWTDSLGTVCPLFDMCPQIGVENTLMARQNGRHLTDVDDIFNSIFYERCRILIQISLKCVSNGSSNNNLALVQIMALSRTGDKPLLNPMTA